MALPKDNRLGWKGLPGTNTPAYCENSSIMAVKSFRTLAPGFMLEQFKQTEKDVRKHSETEINLIGHYLSNRLINKYQQLISNY